LVLEFKDVGDDVGGECAVELVHLADIGVVEAPACGDAIFGERQFFLQRQEVCIGFEFWVGLDDDEEFFQADEHRRFVDGLICC